MKVIEQEQKVGSKKESNTRAGNALKNYLVSSMPKKVHILLRTLQFTGQKQHILGSIMCLKAARSSISNYYNVVLHT